MIGVADCKLILRQITSNKHTVACINSFSWVVYIYCMSDCRLCTRHVVCTASASIEPRLIIVGCFAFECTLNRKLEHSSNFWPTHTSQCLILIFFTMAGVVKAIADDSQFQPELANAGNKLVVVDFFAGW